MKKTLALIFTLVFTFAPASLAADDWVSYPLLKDKAAISMPGDVKPKTLTVHVSGKAVDYELYSLDNGAIAYLVGSYELPAENAKAVDDELARCITNTGGKLLSSKKISGPSYEGLEVVVKLARDDQTATLVCRILRSKNSIFNITLVTTQPVDDKTTALLAKFFGSFTVK